MNAPLLWIVIPLLAAILLWLSQSRGRIADWIPGVLCLLLAVLAWRIPLGGIISIGKVSFEFSTTLTVLGRRFIITNSDLTFIELIYAFAGLWLLGSRLAGVPRAFPAVAMGMLALMIAAVSVEPFLYAALLIEIAVLISIPILITHGIPPGQGVLRYLIFQTLALPVVLLAGWSASQVELNPTETSMIGVAIGLLGLGFAIWLAVFPFYTWLPLMAAETHPYSSAFILTTLSNIALIFGLNFLDSFSWLREDPLIYQSLIITGTLMVATGGIWALFQQDLRRVLAYAVIIQNGYALLLVGINSNQSFDLLSSFFIPRIACTGLLAFGISILMSRKLSPTIVGVRGLIRTYPAATLAIAIAMLSLGGLPLLASFPIYLPIFQDLFKISTLTFAWVVLGGVGFLICGLRWIMVLLQTDQKQWNLGENWREVIIMGGGILFLVILGIFPRLFTPGIFELVQGFQHLIK